MNSSIATRRHVLVCLAALGATACGDNPLGRNVIRAIQMTTVGMPGVEINRERVNNLPYASMAANIGKGPRSILILWRTEREDLHWIAADGSAVVTRGGRVVKTAGLPINLRESLPVGNDPISQGLQNTMTPVRAIRMIDADDAYGMRIDSTIEPLGPATISIAEIDFDTLVFREINQVQHLNWTFENLYWVDPADGFVWKSRQYFSRIYPPLEIEILKPAG
jgi:hypothetical protein